MISLTLSTILFLGTAVPLFLTGYYVGDAGEKANSKLVGVGLMFGMFCGAALSFFAWN